MSFPQAQPITTGNSQVPQAVAEVVDNTSQGISSIASNVSDNVNSATNYVKDSISSFSDSDLVGSTSNFLESNTIIAKFAFLILVLIIFMI